MVTYLGLLVQLCCGEGGTLQTSITGMCGECMQCMDHTGFAPAHGACAFLVYTAQAPGCSEGELSKVAPVLHALPRSKLLRLRFSDISQRHRLGWACILCPSQVQGAQVTRCLASALSQCVVHLITSQLLGFLVALQERCFRCVSSGGLISGCDPPGRCQPSRIPGRHG